MGVEGHSRGLRRGRAAAIPQPKKPKAPRRVVLLTEKHVRQIQAMRDFSDGAEHVLWDSRVRGLRLRVGRNKASWSYFQQHQVNGKRSTTSVTLGAVESGMGLIDARKAALMLAGRNAAGRLKPGRRDAVKFAAAFAEYVLYLESKAARRGKAAVWAGSVRKLGRLFLLPEFQNWPLADLSGSPAIVRDWHRKVTKDNGPVQANRAAQVLRAVYRHAAKLARPALPPALPTSAVLFNIEQPAEKGVDDFAAWAAAWRRIPSPVRRGFHLAQLLLGMRGGECAALRWSDIDCKARAVILRNPKGPSARPDVFLPMSVPIVHALRLARPEGVLQAGGSTPSEGAEQPDRSAPSGLVFPGCAFNAYRDGLPAHGHALRHAFRSVCKAIGIDDVLAKLLMAHSLGGVNENYLSRGMLRGPLREAQRRISADIMKRLGLTLDRAR